MLGLRDEDREEEKNFSKGCAPLLRTPATASFDLGDHESEHDLTVEDV